MSSKLRLCFVFAASAVVGASFFLTMHGLWALIPSPVAASGVEGCREERAAAPTRVVFILVPAAPAAAAPR
jgi:hypothetical protein